MSDQGNSGSGNGGNTSFSHAFLPGLILGLIIGAVAGAYLPDVMSSSKLAEVDPDVVLDHPDRDARSLEGAIDDAGEGLEELGEDAAEVVDDAAETIEEHIDDHNDDG